MNTIRFSHNNSNYTATKLSGGYGITRWGNLGSSRTSLGKVSTGAQTEAGIIRAAKKRIEKIEAREVPKKKAWDADKYFDFSK